MTDNTQPDVGSTYIIRYALELGLLWIDGDGRDKVREALDALDTLEAQLEAVGAGGMQALSAAPKASPQQEAQEPVAISEAIERMAADRYKVVPSHESMFHRWAVVAGTGTQQLYLGREVECQNMARKFAGAFLDGAFVAMQQAAPQQAAQEPVAWMWQHEETGRTGFVDCWQIENGFQENNPQLRLVAKLYAAPQPAPAQKEWRHVLPGGRYTDEWESARVGDYNRGWNDYRKAAIAALSSAFWPARASGNWVGASTWLRNNYQDYPNIASLCDAMLEAAPQQEPVSPISIGWGRDYQDNGKPIDASVAPVPDFALAPQQEAQEPYAYAVYFPDQPKVELVHDLDELIDDLTNRPHAVTKLYTAPQPAPAPLSDDTKRLDWMDKDAGERVFHVCADWYTRPTYGQPYRKHKNLRAAIDAAISAQGGTP